LKKEDNVIDEGSMEVDEDLSIHVHAHLMYSPYGIFL